MIYSIEQKLIAEQIYNEDIRWGKDFIKNITSIKKEDREKDKPKRIHFYFSSKSQAFRKAKLFIETLNDLASQKLIIIHEHPDRKSILNFILKEPQKDERVFTEFHDFFDDYLNLEIQILPNPLKSFINRDFLTETEHKEKKFIQIHIYVAYFAIFTSLLTLVSTFVRDCHNINYPQKVIIEGSNATQTDTLKIEITNPSP
jgi:hypothetical protein